MERQLKERLIGAAVLVALAVILVPEMFSGTHGVTDRTAQTVPEARTSVSAAATEQLKTYHIDLQSTPQTAIAEPVAQPAPEPVTVQSSAESLQMSSVTTSVTAMSSDVAASSSASGSVAAAAHAAASSSLARLAQVSSRPSDLVKTPEKSQEKSSGKRTDGMQDQVPVAPVQNTADNAAGEWVVQVGSFGAQDKAKQIAAELKRQGMPAFVAAVTVKDKTLYRVRIGPMARARADATLSKLGKRYAGASVVSAAK